MKATIALAALLFLTAPAAFAASDECEITVFQSCEAHCGPGYQVVRCLGPKSGATFDLVSCVSKLALRKVCAPGGVPTRTSFEGEAAPQEGSVSAAGGVEDAPESL